MKLFEKIPASFFSILASPNRELYWTALVTLHHLLEYDLNIPVEDYCIALGDTLSDMELTAEDTLDEEEQREAMLDWMQKRIQCENQAFADGGSLWHPTVRSRRSGAPDRLVQEPSPEEERELLQTFRADRSRRYSIARAWQYLAHMLEDREMVTSEELTLEQDDQFVWLLMAAVRSTDRNAPFSVEFLPGETENNGYRIPHMRISRRGTTKKAEKEEL